MKRTTLRVLLGFLVTSAAVVVGSIVFWFWGLFDSVGNMAAAEANGISGITEVTQFAAMFPHADHFITHYSGTKGDSIWNSRAGVHGRYVIVLTFKIDFDPSRTQPKRISPPTFHLREIAKIEEMSDGKLDWNYSKNQIHFGIDEWNRLRESGGDLSHSRQVKPQHAD